MRRRQFATLGVAGAALRPGGHITCVSIMPGAGGLTGKRIELLKDALPVCLWNRPARAGNQYEHCSAARHAPPPILLASTDEVIE